MSRGARTWTVIAVAFAAAVAVHPVSGDSLATTPDTAARGLVHAAAAGESLSTLAGSALSSQVLAPAETVATASIPAPVFLGGKEIFIVRSPRAGLTPAARAGAIRARLDAVVRDPEIPADSVVLHRTQEGIEVTVGERLLWIITRGDVAGMTVSELAAMLDGLPGRLTRGILRERAGRSPIGLLTAILIAIGITLLAIVLARLLLAAGRRWRAFLDRSLPNYLPAIRIGAYEILSKAQITGIVVAILGRAGVVLGLLLLYGYLTAIFSLFPWSQGWSWRLLSFARDEMLHLGLAISRAIPSLLILAAIFLLFRWLTELSDHLFDAIDSGTVQVEWIHQELARPTKRLVRILLWVLGGAIAYPFIPGSDSKAVQGVSILLGVMLSLGSTGIVGNIIAGLVLTYTRAFSRGDRVRIGEHMGDIVNLGFFATKLRSVRNEEITLPNGQIAAQPIVNYTRLAGSTGLILHTQVTIGYDDDWRTVHALLIEAAGRVDGIEPLPAPWVFQRSLNDSHITYEICCITKRSHEQLTLYSRLHEEIQDAFARAGLEILSPAYHAMRDANAAVLPKEPKGPRPEPGGFRVRPPGT